MILRAYHILQCFARQCWLHEGVSSVLLQFFLSSIKQTGCYLSIHANIPAEALSNILLNYCCGLKGTYISVRKLFEIQRISTQFFVQRDL